MLLRAHELPNMLASLMKLQGSFLECPRSKYIASPLKTTRYSQIFEKKKAWLGSSDPDSHNQVQHNPTIKKLAIAQTLMIWLNSDNPTNPYYSTSLDDLHGTKSAKNLL